MADITTDNLDSGSDSPASARAQILEAVQRINLVTGSGSGQGAVNVPLRDTPGNWDAADLEAFAQEVADLSTHVNLLKFFTAAQRADYLARTAQTSYATALDLSSAIQTAIYTTYAAGRNLYCPGGAAKCVTGLEVPTNSVNYEDRGDAWQMVGQGAAQTFVNTTAKGTVFVTNTDTPVLRYHQRRTMPTAGGNTRINHIRFEQRNVAATSPVVLWDTMSEYAEFAYNQILQFGTGNGLEVTYHIKGDIHHNFVMYGGYFTTPTATKSTAGIAINVPSTHDSGLLTIYKNSARNFNWGYVVGDGTNDPSASRLEQNEVSSCNNGFWIKPAVTSTTLDTNFTEAVTGTLVKDEGICTKIKGGIHYLGFSVGIDATSLTNYGTVIEGNYLETSGSIPCTLVKVGSGGPTKTVRENHLLFSTSGGSVAGVVGLELSGVTARINHHSNAYNPRGRWIGGAGTMKINDLTTGGPIGLGTGNDVDLEFPKLARGAMSYIIGTTLTHSNVTAGELTVGEANYYPVNATSAVTVQKISAANYRSGQPLIFRTQSALMTFQDTAQLFLDAGASFTGPGIIEFIVEQSGSTTFAYERNRTVF